MAPQIVTDSKQSVAVRLTWPEWLKVGTVLVAVTFAQGVYITRLENRVEQARSLADRTASEVDSLSTQLNTSLVSIATDIGTIKGRIEGKP